MHRTVRMGRIGWGDWNFSLCAGAIERIVDCDGTRCRKVSNAERVTTKLKCDD